MNLLAKATVPLNDLFQSMTPAARIMCALLLAVVLVSLAFLLSLESSAPDDYVLGGHLFSTADLAAAHAAFAKAGLSKFQTEANRIRVPPGEQNAYVAALVDANAMPRHIGSWWDEYQDRNSLFEPEKHRDIRFKLATQRELAQVIRAMTGIEHASVQFAEFKTNGLRSQTEVTAAVAIMPTENTELEPERVTSIRDFVAAAIPGLKATNVTVMDMNAGYSYPGGSDGASPGGRSDYASQKRTYEQEWRRKITELLGYIPGVKVVTNVILDSQIDLERSSVKFDPQVVNTRTQSSLTSERTVGQRSPGEPSAVTNTSNQQATITQPQGQELDKQHETEVQEGVPSYEQVVSKMAPLTPQRVTVSVAGPRSYYRRVWEVRNGAGAREPTHAPEEMELEKIEAERKQTIHNAVVTLLHPRSGGQDDYALVHVSTFDDQTLAPPPAPGRATQAVTWLAENWSTLGMMVVGLAGLLVLRGILRAAPSGAGPPAGFEKTWSVLRPDQTVSNRGQAAGNRVRPGKRFAETDSSPREELAQMVNDDPEAAADILRAWIGQTQ